MLVTSIFSFSNNVLHSIKDRYHHFATFELSSKILLFGTVINVAHLCIKANEGGTESFFEAVLCFYIANKNHIQQKGTSTSIFFFFNLFKACGNSNIRTICRTDPWLSGLVLNLVLKKKKIKGLKVLKVVLMERP